MYYSTRGVQAEERDLFEVGESLGLNELVVLCCLQNHWLSHSPALQYGVAIKSTIKKLLLEEFLKNDKGIVNSDKYLAIKKALDSKEVEIEIEFLISIKPIFEFMTKFQMERPVIHLLHSSCVKLLKVALGRLFKSSIYIDKKGKTLKETDPERVSAKE